MVITGTFSTLSCSKTKRWASPASQRHIPRAAWSHDVTPRRRWVVMRHKRMAPDAAACTPTHRE